MTEFKTIYDTELMSEFGKNHVGIFSSFFNAGSFTTSLRETFYKADQSNKERLLGAFPHLFNSLDLLMNYPTCLEKIAS